MTSFSIKTQKAAERAIHVTLSLPVQATLYTSLCAITIWTVFFSTYPPVHDQTHALRHHTAGIACH